MRRKSTAGPQRRGLRTSDERHFSTAAYSQADFSLAPHRRFVKLFWLIRAIYVALGTTRRILKLIDSRWKRLGRRADAFVKTDNDVCFARASAYRARSIVLRRASCRCSQSQR
jgi:hypothetical protein